MKKTLIFLLAVMFLVSVTRCYVLNSEDDIMLKMDKSSLSSSDIEVAKRETMQISLQDAISGMQQVENCTVIIKDDSATLDIQLVKGIYLTDEDEQSIKKLVATSSNIPGKDVTIVINE